MGIAIALRSSLQTNFFNSLIISSISTIGQHSIVDMLISSGFFQEGGSGGYFATQERNFLTNINQYVNHCAIIGLYNTYLPIW